MSVYIAVDIGGTRLRVATYAEEGTKPLRQKRIATRSTSATAVERLMSLVSDLWPTDDTVAGISVAAPGPVDPDKGVIYSAPNIAGWKNLFLRDILQDHFRVPVMLGNDANLAALGEYRFGAGRGHHDLMYLTISTGIGGGVIVRDKLMLGAWGLAAELGHVTIDPNGPRCGCGHLGHLEAYSSGTAIAAYLLAELLRGVPSTLRADPPPTTVEIAAAAEAGDPLSLKAFARAGKYLGIGLGNYLHIFNPSIVIFGGGVSRSGPLLFDPMKACLAGEVLSSAYIQNLIITTAALGDDAGLLGALALIRP